MACDVLTLAEAEGWNQLDEILDCESEVER